MLSALASAERHWRTITIGALIGLILVAGVTLARPNAYTASASFVPTSSSGSRSRFAGLAAQFGVVAGVGGNEDSPALYGALLRSHELLRATVLSQYAIGTATHPERGTLVDLLKVRGATPAERVERAVARLHDGLVRTSIDQETSIVGIDVTAGSPELAQQICARMLQLVSEFNLHRRQTQAANERSFVESRLAEARDSLRAAEDRLAAFRQQNRILGSPELQLEQDRLERAVTLNHELYTTLAESYDQARIDEARNTPVVTVIEPARAPVDPDSRHLLARLVMGLFGGAVLALMLARVREVLFAKLPEQPRIENYPARV